MATSDGSAATANGAATKLEDVASIRYLDPEACRFARTDGGFLRLDIEGGGSYQRVHLYRTFPFTLGDDYLSVRDAREEAENKEIGVIRRLDEFPGEAVALIQEELARRYFQPAITRILSMKEEFGYGYWEVETNAGRRRFTVRDTQRNVLRITTERILITDVDGNRFEVPDYTALDVRSRRVIERLI